ncbi:hypothetical protein BDV23DRAFT_181065 [Aspergillus alliaceus]|uniref:Uncharacterized protein n=1 Tax=Petromyces alliaceus TaxID=209559 RepID=A0A5N7CHC2_PETAA|nr:hypothetical protein BDV23DRAFT_181065 [Aspergillus alliaceus]
MALSFYSSMNLEDVAIQGKQNPFLVHISFYEARRKMLEIFWHVEGMPHEAVRIKFSKLTPGTAARFKAVVVSGNVPLLGICLNEYRDDFQLPPGATMPMLANEDVARHRLDWLNRDVLLIAAAIYASRDKLGNVTYLNGVRATELAGAKPTLEPMAGLEWPPHLRPGRHRVPYARCHASPDIVISAGELHTRDVGTGDGRM